MLQTGTLLLRSGSGLAYQALWLRFTVFVLLQRGELSVQPRVCAGMCVQLFALLHVLPQVWLLCRSSSLSRHGQGVA